MSTPPLNEVLGALHKRLVEGDPTAPAELFLAAAEPLAELLRGRGRGDPAPVHDAVVDALMDLSKKPHSYEPQKGEVWTFLVVAARRNLSNLLRSHRRARNREFRFMGVAVGQPAGNLPQVNSGEDADRKLAGERLAAITDQVMGGMNEQDLSVLRLIADGVRDTGPYAHVLQVGDLPEAEQRRKVKNAKDRLLKRLRRASTEPPNG